jgi:glycosyltransferase involved in cell wall biosynthesis
MRILALASWWPDPADNGIRLRIGHLLRALARDHEIHLLALIDEPHPPFAAGGHASICASAEALVREGRGPRAAERLAGLLGREPSSVRAGWSPAFAALVRARAAELRPDLVLCFELSAAIYGRLVADAPLALDDLELAHLAEQVHTAPPGPRRARRWLTWWKHQGFVREVLRSYALCTVTSERELALARALTPRSVALALVPNGADVAGCSGDWGAPEPDTLIYPGSITYDLNLDAVRYFAGEILPAVRARRPAARLLVTGKTTPELLASVPPADGVVFTGRVPDVRPLVARAWAEVVPLRYGSGTRLKVLEAMALGVPVIATRKGIEGLDLEPGREVLLADDAAAFAATTLRLLDDPALRARVASAGRAAVAERYDWRAIGARFAGLMGEAAAARRGATAALA